MDKKINAITDSEKEIEITLKSDEIKDDIDKEIREKSKNIQIDGFRKGKAPKSVIEKRFGKALKQEAAEKVAGKKFWDAAKAEGISPISEPVIMEIDYDPETELKFKVRYEEFPKIDPTGYTGLTIEVPDFQARDEEVEQELDKILSSNAELEPAEKIEDENYLIKADLTRIDDAGNPMEGSGQNGMDINLSDPNVNPDIVKAAVGTEKDGEFEFSFEQQHTHGEGEDHVEKYTYYVVVRDIKKIVKPELDEEFIKKISNNQHSDVDELKKAIKDEIQNFYDSKRNEVRDYKLENEIVGNNDFEPPKTLVKNYMDNLYKQEQEARKKEHKATVSKEDFVKAVQERAEQTVKWIIIRDEIIKKENIEATEELMKELAEENAEKMGVSVDTLMKHYQSDEMKRNLVIGEYYKFLHENNTIKKVDPEKLKEKEEKEQDGKK